MFCPLLKSRRGRAQFRTQDSVVQQPSFLTAKPLVLLTWKAVGPGVLIVVEVGPVFLLSPSCHQQEGWILLLHDPQRSSPQSCVPQPITPTPDGTHQRLGATLSRKFTFPSGIVCPRLFPIHSLYPAHAPSPPHSSQAIKIPGLQTGSLIQDQGQQSQRQGRSKVQQALCKALLGLHAPRFLPASPHLLRLSSLPILVCVFGVSGFMSQPPSFHLCPLRVCLVTSVCMSLSPHSFVDVCVSVFLSLSVSPLTRISALFLQHPGTCVCV